MSELYLVPSVPNYALLLLCGRKVFKSFRMKECTIRNVISPLFKYDKFLSAKFLLFRFQSLRKRLRRWVFLL